jgi:hypothetical protein
VLKEEWQWKEIRPLGDFSWLIGSSCDPPISILSFKRAETNDTLDIAIKPFEVRPARKTDTTNSSSRSKSSPVTFQLNRRDDDHSRRAMSQVTHPVYSDHSERISKLEKMVDSLQKETRTGRLELHQQFTHAQSSFDRNLKNTTAKLEGKIEQLKADMPTRFSIMQDVKDALLPEIQALFGQVTRDVKPNPVPQIPKTEHTATASNKRPLSPRTRDRTPRGSKSRELRKNLTE